MHVWVSGAPTGTRSQGYSKAFPMLEVKGENGKATFYGVDPQKGGKAYSFTQWPPVIMPYADLPLALRTHVESKRVRSEDGSAPDWWFVKQLEKALQRVNDGDGRNDTGFWFIQRLWHQHCNEVTMRAWGQRYQEAVTDVRDEPYTVDEINDTIKGFVARDPAEREPEAITKRPDRAHALTDIGMAERLVDQYGDVIRYSFLKKRWFVWNGRYWQGEDTGTLMRYAKAVTKSLYADAARAASEESQKALAKAAATYSSTMKLRLFIESAQSEEGIAILPTDMDSDPYLFNVQNGTVDLRTGELRHHSPADLITRMAPVDYDPDARDQRWRNFLMHATAGDRTLGAFLQRAAFAALVGAVQDKVFLYLHGPGNTGKSTFLEMLQAAWGPAYCGAVDGSSFLKRQFAGGIRSDLARMDGMRLVVSNEMGEGQIDEPLLKKLTGGDTITFEEKYVNPWQNSATFTIFMAGNDVPKALVESEALWNRWRQVPFVNKIPNADPKWLETVKREPAMRSAVLAWAVRGRAGWNTYGIQLPPSPRRRKSCVWTWTRCECSGRTTASSATETACGPHPTRSVRRTGTGATHATSIQSMRRRSADCCATRAANPSTSAPPQAQCSGVGQASSCGAQGERQPCRYTAQCQWARHQGCNGCNGT